VSSWYAERKGQSGFIVADDLQIGELFGGAEGFTAKLKSQGFDKVRILRTPQEVASARIEVLKALAAWAGPRLPEYPWEAGRPNEYELH